MEEILDRYPKREPGCPSKVKYIFSLTFLLDFELHLTKSFLNRRVRCRPGFNLSKNKKKPNTHSKKHLQVLMFVARWKNNKEKNAVLGNVLYKKQSLYLVCE